ncbi:YegP family protein [Sphingomonas sp. NCPPB 2930]
MPGFFDLKRSGTQYMFNLKSSGNEEVVLTSERYTTKQSAETGIASVKRHAPSDTNYRKLTASNGSPYFTLNATTGEVIGTSELYSSTTARDDGITWVKTNAPSAPTVDRT